LRQTVKPFNDSNLFSTISGGRGRHEWWSVVTSSSAARVVDERRPLGITCDVPNDTPPFALSSPLTALIVVPTLQAGASDAGAIALVRILANAGHKPIVVSSGGRLVPEAEAAGATCITLDAASRNPIVMLRNAFALKRIIRKHRCDLVHAHGRTAAWSSYIAARMTGVPFITTWYKGFREQNNFKRFYNSVMARGTRIIAVSEQIAELINERHGTPWERIAVVPSSVDVERFNPSAVSRERIEAVRRGWGVGPNDRVILVAGRMLRRKGHHVVIDAARRLKAMGLKDFVCVFASEDQGTRYAGELWDRVLSTGTSDVIRMTGALTDPPAAYAAATAVVSAAVQPEGLQRALLEAQAMARPVVVSDLGAGPDVVLAPPVVPEDRTTGLKFPAGDDAALAATLVRLFSMSDPIRSAIGARGRAWVLGHFNRSTVTELTLNLYAEVAGRRNA
jgi:glycosyltransferase involved in cell wall biosynthesis